MHVIYVVLASCNKIKSLLLNLFQNIEEECFYKIHEIILYSFYNITLVSAFKEVITILTIIFQCTILAESWF